MNLKKNEKSSDLKIYIYLNENGSGLSGCASEKYRGGISIPSKISRLSRSRPSARIFN